MLFGAVPLMILAIVADFALVRLQRRLTPWSRPRTAAEDADDPGVGRGLMELIGETVAWLTDPANWQGPDGIPARLVEHILVSAAALAGRDRHRAAGRALRRPHAAGRRGRGQRREHRPGGAVAGA